MKIEVLSVDVDYIFLGQEPHFLAGSCCEFCHAKVFSVVGALMSTSQLMDSSSLFNHPSSNKAEGMTSRRRQSTPGIRNEYSLQKVCSVLPRPCSSKDGKRSKYLTTMSTRSQGHAFSRRDEGQGRQRQRLINDDKERQTHRKICPMPTPLLTTRSYTCWSLTRTWLLALQTIFLLQMRLTSRWKRAKTVGSSSWVNSTFVFSNICTDTVILKYALDKQGNKTRRSQQQHWQGGAPFYRFHGSVPDQALQIAIGCKEHSLKSREPVWQGQRCVSLGHDVSKVAWDRHDCWAWRPLKHGRDRHWYMV